MQIPEYGCLELRCYLTWMGKDGIARTVVKKDTEIVLADAQENSKAINQLIGPEKFTLIVDAREIKSISREAREFFSLRGRESRVVGFAFIIGSPLSSFIGNFFIHLNKPRVPVKLFTDQEKAKMWCTQIMKEYNERR